MEQENRSHEFDRHLARMEGDFNETFEIIGYRTRILHMDEVRTVSRLWRPAQFVEHGLRGAIFELPSGARFSIGVGFVIAPSGLDHDWMHGLMLHAQTCWNNTFRFMDRTGTLTENRTWERAYSEVYGVEMIDTCEAFVPTQLPLSEINRLPEMRREIRAWHGDAPPAPPNEVEHLKAHYAARYPFRQMAIA